MATTFTIDDDTFGPQSSATYPHASALAPTPRELNAARTALAAYNATLSFEVRGVQRKRQPDGSQITTIAWEATKAAPSLGDPSGELTDLELPSSPSKTTVHPAFGDKVTVHPAFGDKVLTKTTFPQANSATDLD